MSELVREQMLVPVANAIRGNQVVIVTGRRGFGQFWSVNATASLLPAWEFLPTNGNWHAFGYLAGLSALVDEAIAWSEGHAPDLIVRHQHSLKRLLPLLESQHFTVPKDLTNTSSREERTRFYHHEYQLKLLFGLATFLIEYLERARRAVLLVIDSADQMSPTAKNLIKTVVRLSGGDRETQVRSDRLRRHSGVRRRGRTPICKMFQKRDRCGVFALPGLSGGEGGADIRSQRRQPARPSRHSRM